MALILVADDHPAVAGAVAALVRSLGHEPVVAGGGREALNVIRTRPVEVAILDVDMPDLSGLDVLRSLRDGGAGPAVVMFSGYDDERRRAEALALGAVGYVRKSDPMGLRPVIEEYVRPRDAPAGAAD